MIASAATVLALAAFAGALASWIAGAVFCARTLRATEGARGGPARWLAVVAWPFALRRLQGAGADAAGRANKALVAFLACLMLAAAATSVATNLHKYSS